MWLVFLTCCGSVNKQSGNSGSDTDYKEFLKPLGLTKYRFAKDIGVPTQRIGEIVSGKRAVTADIDLRLCRYFGLSDEWWLRGQAADDTAIAKEALQKELAAIQRCSLLPV
jgi:addiction module HigA family antidote